ncbi:MAG: glycosyltransferase family 2 protein [Thermoleophilia bacterium]|nr:glycosyltransferase family 2 protein [Thermoleophilia bacterium]
MQDSTDPDITAVIPTRNSARTLAACLESIRRQQQVTVEIIVVDNRSTDGTPDVARRLADRLLEEGDERSEQRNAGLREARGRAVTFIDSDMALDPQVLQEAVAALDADPAKRGVIVPERSIGEGFWSACKALERSCYPGDDTVEAARVFRRDEVREAGGYDPRLVGGGEDWDLPIRLGATGAGAARTQAMITHDEGRIRLWSAARKKAHYGHTIGLYLSLHPGPGREQARFLRGSFRRHARRLLGQPHLLAGMVVLRLVEYAALGVGALRSPYRGSVVRAVLGRASGSSAASSRAATTSRS